MTHLEERFEALYRQNYGDVLTYAVRRCPSTQDAEDVVAETFAVAWRRMHEIPDGDEARLWLFGTARLVRMNHHRTDRRRQNLLARVRDRFQPGRTPTDVRVTERDRITQALASLTDSDREVLQLHVWEDLAADQIGVALEISTAAVWKRLQRARDRLADALDEEPDVAPVVALAQTGWKEAR